MRTDGSNPFLQDSIPSMLDLHTITQLLRSSTQIRLSLPFRIVHLSRYSHEGQYSSSPQTILTLSSNTSPRTVAGNSLIAPISFSSSIRSGRPKKHRSHLYQQYARRFHSCEQGYPLLNPFYPSHTDATAIDSRASLARYRRLSLLLPHTHLADGFTLGQNILIIDDEVTERT